MDDRRWQIGLGPSCVPGSPSPGGCSRVRAMNPPKFQNSDTRPLSVPHARSIMYSSREKGHSVLPEVKQVVHGQPVRNQIAKPFPPGPAPNNSYPVWLQRSQRQSTRWASGEVPCPLVGGNIRLWPEWTGMRNVRFPRAGDIPPVPCAFRQTHSGQKNPCVKPPAVGLTTTRKPRAGDQNHIDHAKTIREPKRFANQGKKPSAICAIRLLQHRN